MQRFLVAALTGLVQGFFFLCGERCALLAVNYARDLTMAAHIDWNGPLTEDDLITELPRTAFEQ